VLPLEIKIQKTKQRIREWVYHWGKDKVYISFSGGKDSTVLLHLIRSEFPDIVAVFSDTGLEYPEIKDFVKNIPNVVTVKPKRTFVDVVKTEGYPVISKKVARQIRDIQNPTEKNEATRTLYLTGVKMDGSISKYFKLPRKYLDLANSNIKVSEKCCDYMKKQPLKDYERLNKKKPFVGVMAEESQQRESSYLKTGCNSFEGTEKSQPIGFWTEQDILQYIKINNLSISSIYGEIVEENGKLKTTGESRTGCMFCMFGVHLEKGENRFQRMKKTHPKIYDYCIRDDNGLGLGKILDFIGVAY
jgi:3'-phosphoadenosine 5'-phosphosulfate sulfotransferase (PAPS reductase)/FAD synthetase